MTTPVYFNSWKRVITSAMQNAGLLEELQDPTPEQFAQNRDRLTDLINFYQTQGLKLFLWQDLSITLTAGTSQYSLGPAGSIIATKPIRALQGYFLDSSNNRRPIYPFSWDDWLRLSQTTNQGPITQFFVDKQVSNLVVNFWLTPDATAATGTAHLLIEQQVSGPIFLTDSMSFPIEWFLALSWGLADEICTGQPQSIIDRCRMKADQLRGALEAWDIEDASTQFQPDTTRGSTGTRRFQ